jgi:histidine triad (HIT) family protein
MTDCVFCKLVNGEIPSKKIYEDEEMIAINDINPQAPVHFLVIAKKHIANLMEMTAEDSCLIGRMVFIGQRLAKELGCEDKGARFIFNCKSDALQSVPHVHLHVLGGRVMSILV